MKGLKTYTTTLRAIDPHDGILKTYHGPHVFGKDPEDAKMYLVAHELTYLEIGNEVVEEIPAPNNHFANDK